MLIIILYTLLWFLAGYLPALLWADFIRLPLQPYQLGLGGIIVGLLLLASITRTEQGRRLFYEGPGGDEDSSPIIGCLWGLPFALILAAATTWLVWSGLGGFN